MNTAGPPPNLLTRVRGFLRPRTRAVAFGRRLVAMETPNRSTAPPSPADDPASSRNNRFVEEAPSGALAVSVFDGEWSTRLPSPLHEVTGETDLFDDARLLTTVEALGGVDGQTVLELGPLEGAHTVTLRRLGAERVVAIEANVGAWLRCLVTKEVLGLEHAEFRLGDLRPYLESTDEHFDLAVAIGVLYHLHDPVPVLRDLTRVSDRLVIWTHVHGPAVATSLNADRFDDPETHVLDDLPYRLHPFRYEESLEWSGFCGGTRSTAAWLDADDFPPVLDHLGHEIVHCENMDHPIGPSVLLATRRRS